MRTTRPRTLPEALRELTPEALTELIEQRPDLGSPPPLDLAELAGRSTTTSSISRALDGLNAWQRVVVEALAALPDPTTSAELTALLAGEPDAVTRALDELRSRALLWGDDDQLHLVRPVREAQLPYPGGLAPISPRPLSTARIDAELAACGADDLAVLERLMWAPTGAVRNAARPVSLATARTPVERLLSRQLLRPLDADKVILPREVSWRLRSGRFTAKPVPPEPPALVSTDLDERARRHHDGAAAGAAFGLLHDVELVARAVEDEPHKLLRTGGLSTRDGAALARRLGTDLAHAVFVVECATTAGLLATGTTYALLPTTEYDRWLARDAAIRWRLLAEAWLDAERFYAVSAEPGAHALGPEAEAPAAPGWRRSVLQVAARAGTGAVLDLAALAETIAWHHPRLAAGGSGRLTAAIVVDWTWREASWLGLVALGAVTAFAELPLQPEKPMPDRLRTLFPEPVDRIVIQADLTAVAPGPLAYGVARDLRLLADQESRGGGGVFRFSAASMRRAFDAGWSADDVHRWLAEHSSTGVPQPLQYLVDDVQRRHGSIRVGPAGSYLRVADEAQAALLLNHPSAAAFGLRQIAPGVLIAAVEETELVGLLHGLGQTPAVEDASGTIVSAPAAQRVSRPRPRSGAGVRPAAEIAAALLAAERARPVPEPVDGSITEDTLDQLRLATREALAVRVVYVSADGRPTERDLAPLDLEAGSVRAVDRASAQVITIPLARISSVIPAPSGP